MDLLTLNRILKENGCFIEQKRNTEVSKVLPGVGEGRAGIPTVPGGPDSRPPPPGTGLGLARAQRFGSWSDVAPQRGAGQIRPTIWSICRM